MIRDRNLIPLSHEHQHALALCTRIERGLLPAGDQPGRIVEAYDTEMREHFEAEERFIFPEAARFPELAGLVSQLTEEHRNIEALVRSLRSTAEQKLVPGFAALLRRHVRAEEEILFEEMQRRLAAETLDRIGSGLWKQLGQ